ncbi:MAG: hypothetical protein LQ352_002324 [Teloschistes flavicans]|nr:MAG: hypothetical protein LQ352_002324 [Teloschistes flavicans]
MAVNGSFDWQYLIVLLISGFLSIVFLFYFNRIFASLTSYAIRAYAWHQYGVYIDIQALQISLLGGRCFFKGFRYHGHNETILINDGYITWRYWLRRVKVAECLDVPPSSEREKQDEEGQSCNAQAVKNRSGSSLPCRIKVKVRGVQWFIYNRTPAYETIEKNILANRSAGSHGVEPGHSRPNVAEKVETDVKGGTTAGPPLEGFCSAEADEKTIDKKDAEKSFSTSTKSVVNQHNQQMPGELPSFLMLLPIKIECSKGAIVMGNYTTRAVLIAKTDAVNGQIDAHQARHPDLYKQVFDLDFIHPVVELRDNLAFKASQAPEIGKDTPTDPQKHSMTTPKASFGDGKKSSTTKLSEVHGFTRTREKLFHSILGIRSVRKKVPSRKGLDLPGQEHWIGLTRYLDDEEHLTMEQERWRSIEYGQHQIIVDSPKIAMSLHWDIPGLIPECTESEATGEDREDINGSKPPDWSVELYVHGGLICYGPWADRLRTDIQPMFFPTSYQDAVPAKRLSIGQPRLSTTFKTKVTIEQTTTLMIPTREPSKDWKWKDHLSTGSNTQNEKKTQKGHRKKKEQEKVTTLPSGRPYGWLDVEIQPDSTISFTMDLVARQNGYRNLLTLDIRGPKMSSSVNHGVLLRTQTVVISCDLSYPLRWNEIRQWSIGIEADGLELFLLRDHIFLMTDLIGDWAVGAPAEFYTFVPFKYSLDLRLSSFDLCLNANDSNVINDPASKEENTFLTIWGEDLLANVHIPLTTFRPSRNDITFDIDAQHGGFKLSTPPWNTQHVFLETTEVATMEDLKIDGSYYYFTSTSPALTDVLRMDVHGISPRIRLHGFVVRAFLRIKDNYFGEDIHFRTLDEYQEQVTRQDKASSSESATIRRTRITNDLDVILSITAVTAEIILPSHLYSSASNVSLDVPSLGLDLRFTNYYMDMELSFSPISVHYAACLDPEQQNLVAKSNTQVFIDGLNIRGHRLFGLPPTEPTYVCNWDFDIGAITGECSASFVKALNKALQCFSFTLDDDENALPNLFPPVIHDVTFLRVRLPLLRVWLTVQETALQLSAKSISLEYNDRAGMIFSERLRLDLPSFAIAVVKTSSPVSDSESCATQFDPLIFIESTIRLSMHHRKDEFISDRKMQHHHITLHDTRTRRMPWLINEDQRTSTLDIHSHPRTTVPAMPFPSIPEPLRGPGGSIMSPESGSSRRSVSSRSSSSFVGVSPFLMELSRTDKASNAAATRLQRAQDTNTSSDALSWEEAPTTSVLNEANRDYSRPDPKKRSRTSETIQSLRVSVNATSNSGYSAYRKPRFKLEHASLDLKKVPALPSPDSGELSSSCGLPRVFSDIEDQELVFHTEECERTSLLIDLGDGVRGLCRPQGLQALTSALEELQNLDPVSLLDQVQIDAMRRVPEKVKGPRSHETITEIRVETPCLLFGLLDFEGDKHATSRDVNCDLRVGRTVINTRDWKKATPWSEADTFDTLSAHLILDNMDLTARISDPKLSQHYAAIGVRLYDVTLWGCRGANSTAHMQFRDLESELDIKQTDFIPTLIQCGQDLIKERHDFQHVEARQTERLRLLVLFLATEGQEIPDPPFLTKASYVVRSASSHLRASESWKMVSRLRYVYHVLPTQSQNELRLRCSSASPGCPKDAGKDIVRIFGQLGMWNGSDVGQSILLNEIFGGWNDEEGKKAKEPTSLAIKTSLKAERVRLSLQPGINQSQMLFETIVLESTLRQIPVSRLGAWTVERLASLQLYCSNGKFMLNFDLLGLLLSISDLLERDRSSIPSAQSIERDQPAASIYRMHFVMISDLSTLAVESPNLRVLYLGRQLNSSTVFSRSANDFRPSTTFLNCAEMATMEISSQSHIVSVGKVDRPCVFGNLDGEKLDGVSNSWHLAASCTDLSLKVLEDPVSLLDSAGLITMNEAASIRRMLDNRRPKSKTVSSDALPPTTTVLGRPHVALFFDSYLVSYKILPALSYRVIGRIGRLSVRPGSRPLSDVVLDFDLKEQAHAFSGRIGSSLETISESVIPPTNGRLTYSTNPSKRDVSFQGTIEHISLDANGVHALLATLSRPEIGELAASIHQKASRLYQHYKPAGNTIKEAPAPSIPQPLVFDGYITLVGLGIHTKTVKECDHRHVSQVDFELGHVHLKGNNRGTGGSALKFPEFSIDLRGLHIGLTKPLAGLTQSYGDFQFGAAFQATSKTDRSSELVRAYLLRSTRCEMIMYTETASVVLDVLGDLRDSFKDIDLTNEVKGLQKLRRATLADSETDLPSKSTKTDEAEAASLFTAMYSLEMTGTRMIWRVGDSISLSPRHEAEDLVLSFSRIDLTTRRDNAARLLIQDFQLQMVPPMREPTDRSLNSALLHEVVFNVAYTSNPRNRRLAFQAAGKSLDLRLTSQFILPASHLRRSMALAVNKVRSATKNKEFVSARSGNQKRDWLKHVRLTSLLVDADFAGAIVYVQGRRVSDTQSMALDALPDRRVPQQGRYGQFTHDDAGTNMTLRAPGVAIKVEYKAAEADKSSLNAEVKVDGSSNVLYPSVVPLILEISSSVKDVVGEPDSQAQQQTTEHRPSTSKLMSDDRFLAADPSTIFQNCTLNLGLRICKQDFTLSCQPIARVAATAQVDTIYVTANTTQYAEHDNSFTLSSSFAGLRVSLQHSYSRESSGGFEVQSAVVSLMNSKHLGAPNGISAIAQVSPMKIHVNAKQLQDFLLFREIWLPADLGKSNTGAEPSPSSEPQAYIVQRYQQIASASAFPWNATLSIAKLDFQIDLGQSLGKTGFAISELWVSSTKSSDWEQNLCLGMKVVSLDATGRMSGFVTIEGVNVRTTIRWPVGETVTFKAPLIQASAGFDSVRIKTAFEYQAFLLAEMTSFQFLMYNVRSRRIDHSDRLVGAVEMSTLHLFVTTTSASQGFALYQAFERLIQEKQTAYQASLKELEKFLRRRSTINPQALKIVSKQVGEAKKSPVRDSIRLQTNVMVSMGAVNIGVFPSTFFDTQLFRIQALDASAQFSVRSEKDKLHSVLDLALGQLQVALSGVAKPEGRRSAGQVSLKNVLASANSSRGGTILKVPKVVATMRTWQAPGSTQIDYIFKSAFQGKVDVGWNYSRIGFLRGMWNNHVRALASRLGKPLPPSALQITADLTEDGQGENGELARQEKITAVVNVPQSKYQYTPLEQPIIETPQLRDMGEATPPLEWIGLHRERLPNLTHQIVIVSLLELAREVDDAYSRILGSS